MKKKIPIKNLFGTRIRFIRTSQGISQETLAHISGLDRSYIGGVERGERNISIVNIEKISIALNIPLNKLFEDIYDSSF